MARGQTSVAFPTAVAEATASGAATPSQDGPWSITLAAVGDLMLARGVAALVTEDEPDGPFAHVRGLVKSTDLTVGNLECVLTAGGESEPKAYVFGAPPLAARGLALAGFDVVALANNHSMDFGEEGLLETVASLSAEGVAAVGVGRDEQEAYAEVVVERNGVRFAFLSFAEVPVESGGYDVRMWRAGPQEAGIAWADDDLALEAITRATKQAEVVVVFFHFGLEYSDTPSPRQRAVAHRAVDAGATLVLGSHPHVLQEVEGYGQGLIAYSLGNFVFDGFEGDANLSAVLLVTLGPEGVVSWRLAPVEIGWDGAPRPGR